MTPGGGDEVRASSGGRAAADFTGHVRVAEMDRAGWNVVAAEDFASEHLSRVVQPGSRVMPNQGNATGVVVTGPLTTRSPGQASTADEISRTFSDVGARTDRDITRVMARDDSLRGEDIARLVQPSSLSDLGRNSAQSVVAARPQSTPQSRSNPGGGGGPELTAANQSQFVSPSNSRSMSEDTPNKYLPTRIRILRRRLLSGGTRALVDPSTRSPGATAGKRRKRVVERA